MRFSNLLILVLTFVVGPAALAQTPTYQLGRAPTDEEILARDTIVGPRGTELPPGKGSAKDGAPLFARKCAVCHGNNGQGSGLGPSIVGGNEALTYPFATGIWSYIYNAMPRKLSDPGLRAQALTPEEVYALTAFLLYKDKIIKEDEVMDEKSLLRVHMPGRDHRLDGLVPPAVNGRH